MNIAEKILKEEILKSDSALGLSPIQQPVVLKAMKGIAWQERIKMLKKFYPEYIEKHEAEIFNHEWEEQV